MAVVLDLVLVGGLVGYVAWTAIATVAEAREARREVQSLAEKLRSVDAERVVGHEFVLDVATSAQRLEARFTTLQKRVRPLALLGWVPVLGHKARGASNTVQLGLDLSHVLRLTAVSYGEALKARESGGLQAFQEELKRREADFSQAVGTLADIKDRRKGQLLLDDPLQAAVDTGLAVLGATSYVGLYRPEAAAELFELVQEGVEVRRLLSDPVRLLERVAFVSVQVEDIKERAQRLEREIDGIVNSVGKNREELELLSESLSLVVALAEAGSSLLEIGKAFQDGFLSDRFATVAGSKLVKAGEELQGAKMKWASFQQKARPLGVAENGLGDGQAFKTIDRGLADVDRLVVVLREMLGYNGPRRYLMVLQNQNEIRATGGFIGIGIEVRVDSGKLQGITYEDSFRLDPEPLIDNPPAPEPLYWYLWMGRLLFRDANWNPHFPESAKKLAEIYSRARGVNVDGVFAVNKLVGLDLVDAFGGIRVSELEAVLNSSEAEEYMEGIREYPCLPRHSSDRSKRCFGQDLFQAVMDRLTQENQPGMLARVVSMLREHLKRKNILMFSFEPGVQSFLTAHRWDGSVPTSSQDFLMVVDSSLPGHTAKDIDRTIVYLVELEPKGESRATLRLRYTNPRRFRGSVCRQAAEGGGDCYWNFFRVFLSRQTKKVEASPVPLHEGSERLIWGHREADSSRVVRHGGSGLEGLVEVGGFVAVEPSTTMTIPISYTLGPGVLRLAGSNRYEYRLTVSKQPGMERDSVVVGVRIPDGSEVMFNSRSLVRREGQWLFFKEVPKSDMEIAITFKTRS